MVMQKRKQAPTSIKLHRSDATDANGNIIRHLRTSVMLRGCNAECCFDTCREVYCDISSRLHLRQTKLTDEITTDPRED
jgi:hypothetical protein